LLKQLRERVERQVKESEEYEAERKQQVMGIVTMEQKISEQARDIELKDIKIESLENIIRRRDQQQVDHSS
jgi:hypothetical protein